MLLIIVKGIRGEICHAFHRYAKANNKYIKDCDQNKESSNLKCWDVNNLYGWAMSQKVPLNDSNWVEDISGFDESFTKHFNEESDEGYFFQVAIQYLENLHNLHDDLSFLLERRKIENVEKLIANLHDKTEYITDIRNLKQAFIVFHQTFFDNFR